jgi:hypothetical protein
MQQRTDRDRQHRNRHERFDQRETVRPPHVEHGWCNLLSMLPCESFGPIV